MTPTSVSLKGGQSQQFGTTVSGTTNTAVTWSLTPNVGTISSGLYTAPASVSLAQTVTVTATSSADTTKTASAAVSLQPVSLQQAATVSTATAQFVKTDTTTEGTWQGVYGADGYNVVGDLASYPSYATVTPAGAQTYVWASSTTDVRGLQKKSVANSRIAAAWYTGGSVGSSNFTIDVNLTDGNAHQVALYCSDWSNLGRSERIDILDAGSGALLDSRSVTAFHLPPQYLVWNLQGHVTLKVTLTGGSNGVVSGLFFAPVSTSSTTPPPPPPPVVSISLSPTSVSLQGGQSKQFSATVSGSTNTAVTWSLVPSVGTISGGLYTAPSTVSAAQTVTVVATSSADTTKSASASVSLQAPPPPALGTSAQFIWADKNTQGNWQGVYGVDGFNVIGDVASYPSYATVTPSVQGTWVWAASTTDVRGLQKKSVANSRIAAAWYSAGTVNNYFTIDVNLTDGKMHQVALYCVNWDNRVRPERIDILDAVSGAQLDTESLTAFYNPPEYLIWNLSGHVKIKVTQTADFSAVVSGIFFGQVAKSGLPPVGISVTPASMSLSASQSVTLAATITGTTNNAVTWSMSPAVGSVNNGVYTAPSTISSQQTVTVTATSSADTTKTASAAIMLVPPVSGGPAPITLPLEVMGTAGTTVSASFSIPSGSAVSSPLQLWLQIHGLKYETEASVKVNNSAWTPINSSTVTLMGAAPAFGGIGGGFSTLQMTMSLPAGSVTTGTNTISFEFNGTNNIVSGYRVLAFNIQPVGGGAMIPSSAFVEDDPNTWRPPSTASSDISAGQTLWHTAALTAPTSTGPKAIKAHCADCHSEDGRDLKYFNYSNNSIEVRSVFHGLTAQQGAQIASYIRSLNAPNPGRPWNPPYQPGPGMDSQPVANWSAGAGLDAVLDSDAEMQPYLIPGGSTANWGAHAYLNVREIPVPVQLADWNGWLPQVHPMDAFGTTFTGSQFSLLYPQVRAALVPNSATAYKAASLLMSQWFVAEQSFLAPYIQVTNPNWDANNLRQTIYSSAQWALVKQWEMNQEFGLEGMPQAVFGSTANVRGWYGGQSFNTSPIMLKMSSGAGLGNGGVPVREYLAFLWYQTQLILNDGQGAETDNNPLDFPYAFASIKDFSTNTGNTPAANIELMWLVKSLQEESLKGGPQLGVIKGFVPTTASPIDLGYGSWDSDWTGSSLSTRVADTTAFLQAWFAQIKSYTISQYYTGVNGLGGNWASATENPAYSDPMNSFGGQTWFMLPRFRWLGVDPNLVSQITSWAATVWPAGNWALNLSATCTNIGKCSSDPQ